MNGGISKSKTVEIIINPSYTEETKKKIKRKYKHDVLVSHSWIDFWQLILFSLTQSSFHLIYQMLIYMKMNTIRW